MNLFLRGHGWEPQNLDFVFRCRPGALMGFALGGRAPLGQQVNLKETHLDSHICARSHLYSPFLGQRGWFWPHSSADGFDVMGMPREGGQVARFGQELLPLTIYTLSLAT